jgi:inositol oxygenase
MDTSKRIERTRAGEEAQSFGGEAENKSGYSPKNAALLKPRDTPNTDGVSTDHPVTTDASDREEKSVSEEVIDVSAKKDIDWSPANAAGFEFRDYENQENERYAVVEKAYRDMHENQTLEFVQNRHKFWRKFDKGEYTILEVIKMLDELVDDSDPDVDMPNSIHDFMTAERLREAYPDDDWLHLTGLLHDLGKVMNLWGEPQWATVGDTFVTGCKPSEKCVHYASFANNPDTKHEVYGTEYGIYKPNCGLDKLWLSWGHDEYMYWVLKENGSTLPKAGLDMIRYHSFYPWHTGDAYKHLTNKHDNEVTRKWIKLFNQFDLYSKADEYPDIEKILPYYEGLLKKYKIDGVLRW